MTIEPINAFNGSRVRVTITSVLPPGLGGSGDQIAYAHYRYIDRMSPPQDGGTFRVARVYPRKGVSAAALAATVERPRWRTGPSPWRPRRLPRPRA
ncbi:hypothetical protein [Stenotrophomonas sp.]|uniref:hypothetical protein n=1 Tax=Stenotrophomonas sp. TaxID=69392 RepID=UPI00289F4291|nr:hypothetical protein [Stenotrophomonas sp.]